MLAGACASETPAAALSCWPDERAGPFGLTRRCAPFHADAAAVSKWLYLPFFLLATFGFSILMNSRRNQLPAMMSLGCLAFCASTVLGLLPQLDSINSFLSAMLVGCAGNAYANVSGRPGMPATASGVFILVPGAMALRSLSSMFENAFLGVQLTGGWIAVTVQIGAHVENGME